MGPKQDRRTCKGVCFRPVRHHRYRSTKHNCQRQSCSGRSRRVTRRERPISEVPGSSQSGRGLQAPGNRSLHFTPGNRSKKPGSGLEPKHGCFILPVDAAGIPGRPGIRRCHASGLSRYGNASRDRRTGLASSGGTMHAVTRTGAGRRRKAPSGNPPRPIAVGSGNITVVGFPR